MRKLVPSPVCLVALLMLFAIRSAAQTDADALMMKKKNLCIGAMYSYSTWKNYWEGDFKRDNENLGTVSTRMIGVMGNYGITNKLNALFSLPYVSNKASAGTLKGLKGIQDIALALKWKAYSLKSGNSTISLFTIGSVSFPVSNYVADFLPMSIGLRSKNASIKGLIDYQWKHFFVTGSAAYVHRSNITIDRTAYFTDQMHYTNEVKMPDASMYGARLGYRSREWIIEATFDQFNTLGGFDIRKNDMPFPSNKMNMTQAGINLKYSFQTIRGLELTGGRKYTLAGRNVGQATSIFGGVFYILDFGRKSSQTNKKG